MAAALAIFTLFTMVMVAMVMIVIMRMLGGFGMASTSASARSLGGAIHTKSCNETYGQ